ncbi:putative amino-acid permease [Cercophora samala]|uniref:Amino-acid permease n=1 Tax=Cercophora samala TaxID=330535 RepID=A0AA40DAP2_9PEZI|nr:putative amino-acid permease [Cercophora samala]
MECGRLHVKHRNTSLIRGVLDYRGTDNISMNVRAALQHAYLQVPAAAAVTQLETKSPVDTETGEITDGFSSSSIVDGGTPLDKADMYRMGKTPQLHRNFRFLSIFGFTMVLMQTWETELTVSIFGLVNGGTGGLIWMYLGTYFGLFCAILSMAEMASMAPTTGGQYHWVSEFAPQSSQRFLSFIVGWLSVLGWQVGNAAIAFLMAQQIQGLVILNHPSYVPERWHLTLLAIAIMTVCMVLNTLLYRALPLLETLALLLHTTGFLAVLIPLWTMGPKLQSAHDVFFTFTDGGGWGNAGLSCLVGILTPIFSLLGPDSATHMAEELRDASKSLPRAMIATALLNGAMGFVMLVTFCMVLGDLDSVLRTPTTQPHIQVFYNAVGSYGGATVMTCVMVVMSSCGVVNNIATSSRQLWAFARDRGVPFSGWFATVHPRWGLPLNALGASYVFAVLLSLINIGSTVAFNILTSLGVGALISSYAISVGCMALKRIRNEPLLRRSFDLGRMGLAINLFSVLFLLFTLIMTFFPPVPKPTPEMMNWNILVYGTVVFFSVGYYIVRGRFRYAGPVEYVRKSA